MASSPLRFDQPVQLDNGLIIPASAGAGLVLTSDASGNAAWGPSPLPLFNRTAAAASTASTTYVSAGAAVTAPVAGTYLIHYGSRIDQSTGNVCWISLGIAGSAADDGVKFTTGEWGTISMIESRALTAGQVVDLRARAVTGTAAYRDRFISMVRVG